MSSSSSSSLVSHIPRTIDVDRLQASFGIPSTPKFKGPVYTPAEEALRDSANLAPWEAALDELGRLQGFAPSPELAEKKEWLREDIVTAPLVTRRERQTLSTDHLAELENERRPEHAQACKRALSMTSGPQERELLNGHDEDRFDGPTGLYL